MERLKRALAVLEDDAVREIEPGDLQKYTVVHVADEVLVDLLAAACGVTWLEARATALRYGPRGNAGDRRRRGDSHQDEDDRQTLGCRRPGLARVAPGRQRAVGPPRKSAAYSSSWPPSPTPIPTRSSSSATSRAG